MVDIHLKHYKMLKQIENSKTFENKDLSDEQIEIIDFLIRKDFVEKLQYDGEVNSYKDYLNLKPSGYKITQEGLAQISAYSSTFLKWWIPLIVSIASFILSCISLLKQ